MSKSCKEIRVRVSHLIESLTKVYHEGNRVIQKVTTSSRGTIAIETVKTFHELHEDGTKIITIQRAPDISLDGLPYYRQVI